MSTDENDFDGDDPAVDDASDNAADDTAAVAASSTTTRATPATGSSPAPRKTKKQRTSPRQFLREVRSELRKVAWPARKELISYSVVVLVSVTLITLFITGLDYVFGQLILRMFSA